jgi:translation initiation factor IF-3
MFRGREMAHVNLGRRVLDRVLEAVKEVAKADAPSKLEGKNLHLMLSPVKKQHAEDKDQKSSSETV